jgi:uncharacterized membrane protein
MSSTESGLGPTTRDASTTAATPTESTGIDRPSVMDLLLTLVFVLVAAALTLLEAPAGVRIPFGILLVLLLPGYALVSALFPSNDGPDGVARIALSVALSLATIPPLALAIDQSPWRIERVSVTVGLLIVTVVALLCAAILRLRLPPVERYALKAHRPAIAPPSSWSREQRMVVLALGLAGLLFIVGGYDVVKTRLTGVSLTEFALYNADGEARFYPRVVTVGEPTEVQISIANREGKRIAYQIVIAGAGVAVAPLPEITLADGETWREPVHFTVATSGSDLPVRFELYRVDRPAEGEPYRLLQLIVDGQAHENTSS